MHTTLLSIPERYSGPLLLKQGLRPFFLLANLWAFLCMVLWIAVLAGWLKGPEHITALDWHRHELLFGFTSAVMGGFLLTAVANWTKRAPIAGNRLLALVMLWLAGRVVMWQSGGLPAEAVALVDLSFPIVLGAVVGRELILAENYRNLSVLAVFSLFVLANAVFHLDLLSGDRPVVGARLGLCAVLLLIMVVGGRIIPAFTRSWLIKRGAQRLPAAFAQYDIATLFVSAVVLITWAFAGESPLVGWGMLVSGLLQLGRLGRWCGEQTFSEPLVLILHLAYAFVPLGFLAMAAAQLLTLYITVSAATHLWTAGAVAVTCMAVMTRASLGHTGQELSSSPAIVTIYVFLMGSVLLRVVASVSTHYLQIIQFSAVLWCLAHLLFVLCFARLFYTAR